MENQSYVTKVTKRIIKKDPYLGKVFCSLTVIRDDDCYRPLNGRLRVVTCRCVCGNEKEIGLSQLKNGNTRSCGCEKAKRFGDRNRKHGMSGTDFYNVYKTMKSRCENESDRKYDNYGGRGIKNIFGSFDCFKRTMFDSYKKGLSIERIDVNGDYSPENCKWVTMRDQSRNKQNTIRYKGESLVNYCERNGLSAKLVRERINNGWDIELAINKPKMSNRFY